MIHNTQKERIVITGLGPVCGLGIGKEQYFQSLMKGVNSVKKTTSIDVNSYPHQNASEVEDIDFSKYNLDLSEYNKASAYIILATQLAISDAKLKLSSFKNNNVGCFIGTTDGESQALDLFVKNKLFKEGGSSSTTQALRSITHGNISKSVSSYIGSIGPAYTIGNACSASNAAIISGFEYLQHSESDFAFCGGVDLVCRKTFSIFHRLSAISEESCTPFDIDRKGIIPSEGANILILEKLSSAIKRKAHIYGEIVGYAMNCDATHMTNLNPERIAQCMFKCLQSANLEPKQVDYICMHGTGTKANDYNEYLAIKSIFKKYTPYCGSIKSMLGHSMGASAGFGAIACLFALEYGIPPTINLSMQDPEIKLNIPVKFIPKNVNVALNDAFAFGGNNAIIAFRKVHSNYENIY
jgi:beta-ketoacyl synthase